MCLDIPSWPLFVIYMAAVLSRTSPADGTILLGSLLEHGARLGQYGVLLRWRGDDGAWITLDHVLVCVLLGFCIVGLGNERRVRRLVGYQLLVAVGQRGNWQVGSGLWGAWQGGSRWWSGWRGERGTRKSG